MYSLRDQLSTKLDQFVTDAERAAASTALTETEDWLYDEGKLRILTRACTYQHLLTHARNITLCQHYD